MENFSINNKKIYYNDLHDIAAIIEVYVMDVYKSENIKKGSTIIDIGAGIGEFSILASELVGSDGKVIAIEPSPEDFDTLLKNLKENECTNVIPINKALSDKPGVLELEFKGKKFSCDSDSLINIIENSGVDLRTIEFIKMDIEGGEKFVIPSSIDIIKNIKFLTMEIHDSYQLLLIPLMEKLNFNFERITRNYYINKIIKFSIKHPVKAYSLYKLFKRSGEFPGLKKISNGIDISKSEGLVVGTFSKI